jgi:UPF0271 protein
LQPRSEPGSLLTDANAAASQAVRIATAGELVASDGEVVSLRAESICCHGDTPGAATIVASVRAALEAAGVTLGPLGA